MEISVKELRELIREALTEDELLSKKIRKGDIVSFIQHGKKLRGKVIDGYKSTHADPTRVRIATADEMIWAIDVSGKIYHKPEGELSVVKSRLSRFGDSQLNTVKLEAWLVHNEEDETDEASNVASRMSLLHSDESTDDEDVEEELEEGFSGSDTSSTPEDEMRREEKFSQKKYELLARSIIFRYPDKGEGLNWKTIAQNYVRAKRASTGMQLDVDKLYTAITKMVDDMRPERTHVEQGQVNTMY
jgi:hypothetical protein